MIAQHKHALALQALNTIRTRARWIAYEANAPQLAELLDAAEILPSYLAERADFTDEYKKKIRFPLDETAKPPSV